jgi:hypothetical protein
LPGWAGICCPGRARGGVAGKSLITAQNSPFLVAEGEDVHAAEETGVAGLELALLHRVQRLDLAHLGRREGDPCNTQLTWKLRSYGRSATLWLSLYGWLLAAEVRALSSRRD